jgi:hypothetical protein
VIPRVAIIALCLFALAADATAAAHRSRAARAEFQRAVPCPSTGQPRGPCPGYVVDHIAPLCAGGADAPGNMQWQAVAESRVKDRDERAYCRGGARGWP